MFVDAGAATFADVGVAGPANAGASTFADVGACKRADGGASDAPSAAITGAPNCGADQATVWSTMPHTGAMPTTSQLRLEGQRMRFGNRKWT
jgi:hypothetical protein